MICEKLLQKLDPDPDRLLAAICLHVDDAMLEHIAVADYGMEADEHLKQLRLIRDSEKIPHPLDWIPHEVLALTRWSQPEQVRDHIMRAFACACLLRASAHEMPKIFHASVDHRNLGPLLESLPVFDPSIQRTALLFVAWCAQHLADYDTRKPFYLFALLLLVLRTRARFTAAELKELIACVSDSEATARQSNDILSLDENNGRWLLDLRILDQDDPVWVKLGAELAALANMIEDVEVREQLQSMARRLEVKNDVE